MKVTNKVESLDRGWISVDDDNGKAFIVLSWVEHGIKKSYSFEIGDLGNLGDAESNREYNYATDSRPTAEIANAFITLVFVNCGFDVWTRIRGMRDDIALMLCKFF